MPFILFAFKQVYVDDRIDITQPCRSGAVDFAFLFGREAFATKLHTGHKTVGSSWPQIHVNAPIKAPKGWCLTRDLNSDARGQKFLRLPCLPFHQQGILCKKERASWRLTHSLCGLDTVRTLFRIFLSLYIYYTKNFLKNQIFLCTIRKEFFIFFPNLVYIL